MSRLLGKIENVHPQHRVGKVRSQIESKRVSLFLLVFFFSTLHHSLSLSALIPLHRATKPLVNPFPLNYGYKRNICCWRTKAAVAAENTTKKKEKKQQQKTKSMAYACRIGLQFNCNFDPILFVWRFCSTFFLVGSWGFDSSSSLTGVSLSFRKIKNRYGGTGGEE